MHTVTQVPSPGNATAVVASAQLVGSITTAALALVFGKTKPRAARDWCRAHGVPIRRDGKTNWVDLADVRRAIAALPVAANDGDGRAARIARLIDARTKGCR